MSLLDCSFGRKCDWKCCASTQNKYSSACAHFLSSTYETSSCEWAPQSSLYNTVEKIIMGLSYLLFKELLTEIQLQGWILFWLVPLQGQKSSWDPIKRQESKARLADIKICLQPSFIFLLLQVAHQQEPKITRPHSWTFKPQWNLQAWG